MVNLTQTNIVFENPLWHDCHEQLERQIMANIIRAVHLVTFRFKKKTNIN